ncbi:MAG: hypothetical protein RBS76_05165 [Acholeplasmatales bacterium]|nr:hypothetical protein [Acholeplasmataceae bacterium]MDY0115866.1 hypothetical protein [Acholeplasmatales bacterium]
MIKLVFMKQKEKKYLISLIGFTLLFSFIYFMLDYLSGGYRPIKAEFGTYLVVLNIITNIIMSFISALMFNLSTALQSLTRSGESTGLMSFISVIFGFFTFGCTSCMIAFLSAIGISFSVMLLPLYNYPYKLIGLGLLAIVFVIQLFIIKNAKCKIKF